MALHYSLGGPDLFLRWSKAARHGPGPACERWRRWRRGPRWLFTLQVWFSTHPTRKPLWPSKAQERPR